MATNKALFGKQTVRLAESWMLAACCIPHVQAVKSPAHRIVMAIVKEVLDEQTDTRQEKRCIVTKIDTTTRPALLIPDLQSLSSFSLIVGGGHMVVGSFHTSSFSVLRISRNLYITSSMPNALKSGSGAGRRESVICTRRKHGEWLG